jgi:molybdate transport system substrate-binding protein
MTSLNILSGGAAQGLVASLARKFREQTGFDIAGDFGAVGAMAGKLHEGMPTDLVILTSALVADLARENLVVRTSIADIGRVETALAVRAADPPLSVHDLASLKDALLGADAIFVPDTNASTAGIHVAKVMQQLDIADALAARLKIYPNGATAMRHLAESDAVRPIGCTQSTEIVSTRGVKLSGPLPKGCDLSTLYTAAIATGAAQPREAQALIDLLTSGDQQELRTRAGFLVERI